MRRRTRDGGDGDVGGCGEWGEEGFALLVSLIAIVGLTALATGGFFLANAERRMSSNHHASVEAYQLANAGLSQFLGTVSGSPADASPARYAYDADGGRADVTASRVGTARGGEALFLVESVGSYDPNGTGDPVTRTVARIAILSSEDVVPSPPAALTCGSAPDGTLARHEHVTVPDDPEAVDRMDGTRRYLYDACVIDQMQSSLATVAGVPGTWEERF